MTPLKGGGQRHHKVLIVGGGSGGITVASQLLRASPGLDVAILEPAAVHEYQSGWILAGAGLLALPQGAHDCPCGYRGSNVIAELTRSRQRFTIERSRFKGHTASC